ncbi:MFS transporter [Streptomyces sp. HNM0574]|uniref:MFS transporter n=1 Tax=Streptomyces sp. HNM0574 TaxID=2714954 RepID=UPI00146A65E8|nr:MFS transporter [Streptomyces sp. HNM0574]NLU70756.1 MFS transporter [Streptomyces sp. HNM0574]
MSENVGTRPGTGSGTRAGPREWAGLAALALPTLLVSVDMTVLYMALPKIAEDLSPSATQTLWITDIYGFMIAGALITMGTLGDRIGRRRLLMLGGAGFGLASVPAALATSPETLIGTRALLGIAGATLMPSSLALITGMFRDARERASAIAVWMVVYSAGMALGPLVGGLLMERFWWGSVFLLNVPVMLVLLFFAPILLPEFRAPGRRRIDVPSVLLSLAAILPVVYGVKRVASDGGMQVPAVAAMLAGAFFGALFVRRQRARGTDALLDTGLFRNAAFSSAVAMMLLVLTVFGGVYLLFTQYLQLVVGLTPWQAGLWMLPPVLAIAAGNLLAPPLARRMRPAHVCAAGLVVAALGALLFVRAGDGAGTGTVTLGCAVVLFGVSPMMVLGIDLIVGSAPPEKAGAAASVSETGGELGFALGVATLGSLAAFVYRQNLSGALPESLPPEAGRAALEGLAGAVSRAHELGPGTGGALLDAAKGAFTDGMSTVGLAASAASALLAAGALLAFRHIPPTSGPPPEPQD